MHLTLSAISMLPRAVRDPLLRRLARVGNEELEGIEVRLAKTVPEMLDSARLLHEMYVARGLIDPKPSGMRSTPHLLLPSTATFIACYGDKMVGTLSLIVDSPMGLPMEKAFPEEVKRARRPGRRLAEVGALCVAPGSRRQGISLLLNDITLRCSRELLGITDLLISVVPPADELYRANLMFERLGAPRHHPSVKNGVQTVPLAMDMVALPDGLRRAFGDAPRADNPYHRYFGPPGPQVCMPTVADTFAAGEARRRAARLLAPVCATGLDALEVGQVKHLAKAAGLAAGSFPARHRSALQSSAGVL